MSRRVRLVAALMICAAGLALGWQAAAVSQVEVRGAERLTAGRIVEMSGLKPGQQADKAALQAAVERMMATGLFERVTWRTQPGEGGTKVTFTVVEAAAPQAEEALASGPKIERVELRGVAAERAARVRLALEGAMVGREYRQDAVEEVGGPLVRAALAESGHWTPEVKFSHGGDGMLVVEIDEGPVAVLSAVSMSGGDPKWGEQVGFVKGAPAEAGKLNQALGRLIGAARNDGYLGMTARATHVLAGDQLKVVIHVDKGPLYRFGELKIDGLSPQAEARARKLWVLKPGDPAGTAALEDWIRRVFERRIPVWDRAERAWRPREGEAIADAVVSFR